MSPRRIVRWFAGGVLLLAVGCRDAARPGTEDSTTATTSDPVTTGSVGASTSGASSGASEPTGSTGSPATDGADVTGSDTGAPEVPGLAFEPIVLDAPIVRATALAFFPDSSDFVLMSKDGEIVHYALRGDEAARLGSLQLPGVYTSSDCGAISIAFDPEFANNRLFYVGLCKSRYDSAIFRLELGPDYDTVVDTMVEVIEVGHPQAANPWHNVGSIGFDAAGNLWALFGDKTVVDSAQDLSSNLGAIVRIVPDRSPGGSGYEPARDNPFHGDPERSWDVWAYGLRSPWKGLLDSKGRFVVADVGSDHFEEVNMVSAPAQNLGWPAHEGLCDAEDCSDYVDPVVTWPHAPHPYIEDDPDAAPVNARVGWVGAEYIDRGNDRYEGLLSGKILYGDACLGYVRAFEVDDAGNLVFDEHLAHLGAPTSWAQGPDGYLYVVTFGGCGSDSIDPKNPPRVEMLRAVLAR